MPGRRPLWRRVLRAARWLPVVVVVGLALVLADAWTALGHRAVGARRARMERSPQWKDGHFVNPQPLVNDLIGSVTGALDTSPVATPAAPPETLAVTRAELE